MSSEQMRKLRVLLACEMSGRVRDEFAERGWEAWSADLLPSERPAMTFIAAENRWANIPDRPENGPRVRHYQGDVRDLFDWYHPVNSARRQELSMREAPPVWDLVIAFPPCTDLSLAGARYWKEKREPRGYWSNELDRWIEVPSVQDAAAAFFMEMVNAPSPLVAVENPVGDMKRRYRAPDQVVEPFWFGDPLRKKTCLWLKGLPRLSADHLVEPEGRVATGGGSHRTDIAAGRGPSNRHEDGEGRYRRHIVRSRTLPGFARAMALHWGNFAEEYYRNPGGEFRA